MWMKPGHIVSERNLNPKALSFIFVNKKIEGQVIESAMKTTTCVPFFFLYLGFHLVHHPLIIARNKNKQVWPHFRNQSTHATTISLSNRPFSFISAFQLKNKVFPFFLFFFGFQILIY